MVAPPGALAPLLAQTAAASQPPPSWPSPSTRQVQQLTFLLGSTLGCQQMAHFQDMDTEVLCSSAPDCLQQETACMPPRPTAV